MSGWGLPNAVEYLESLGFKFTWNPDEKKCHAMFPDHPEGIGQVFMVTGEDPMRKMLEAAISSKWASEITAFVRHRHEREMLKANNDRHGRCKGGPFDGDALEDAGNTWGKTFPRQVRRGWWAVYVRKFGNMHADFLGFATSKSKAITKQYATRPELDKSQPPAEAER